MSPSSREHRLCSFIGIGSPGETSLSWRLHIWVGLGDTQMLKRTRFRGPLAVQPLFYEYVKNWHVKPSTSTNPEQKENKDMTQNVKGSIYIFVCLFLKYYLQPVSIWPALHVRTKPPFTWNLWSYLPRRPLTTQHNMSLQANLQITTKYPTVNVYVYRCYIHLPWLCENWNTHLILHQSGQIMIFHQPRFSWNKGISLTKPPFGVRSCEVARIWPDQ